MKTLHRSILHGFFLLCLLLGCSISRAQDGSYPNAFRNFISPTAYGLEPGQTLYQNYLLLLHQFYLGLGGNFSVSAGFELASLLDDSNAFPGFSLNLKHTVPVRADQFHLAVGGVILHVPQSEKAFDFGGLYFAGTYGSTERNATLGLGFGIIEGEFAASPAIILGGNFRIGKKIALATDNWYIPDLQTGLISLGIRLIGKRLNWDFAFFGGGYEGRPLEISPLPVVGVLIPLNKASHSPN